MAYRHGHMSYRLTINQIRLREALQIPTVQPNKYLK